MAIVRSAYLPLSALHRCSRKSCDIHSLLYPTMSGSSAACDQDMNGTANTSRLREVEAPLIQLAKRIVIKAGTSVVSTPEGYPSLVRLASIVEQICQLSREGREVLLVTSGSVGIGRQLLSKQARLSLSVRDMVNGEGLPTKVSGYDSACAAAGQLGLMSLYETLFGTRHVASSQILVTGSDFTRPDRRAHIQYCINSLLKLGIIPIINENDAVSGNQGYTAETIFSDNDSLAGLVARECNAELLILLTDVDGVYDRPPRQAGSQRLPVYLPSMSCVVGDKSTQGRGGMQAKLEAACSAVGGGVGSVVVANGHEPGVVFAITRGESKGTLFSKRLFSQGLTSDEPQPVVNGDNSTKQTSDLGPSEEDVAIRVQATACREAQRCLAGLSGDDRSKILRAVAAGLLRHQDTILAANRQDLAEAKASQLTGPLLKRLALNEAKIKTLADGINALAEMDEPLNRVLTRTEVATGLELRQLTVPIGVLLIVFESRPDSLPQIAALALRSGNGLLLKGGKEALHSNAALHSVIVDAVRQASNGRVPQQAITLVTSRSEVSALLELDDVIDLIIPRGSSSLVRSIKSSTRIPVLGHAEGVCHVYLDKEADTDKACRIVVDAKMDYPAACNAVETLLIHQALLGQGKGAAEILKRLTEAGVTVLGGPEAIRAKLLPLGQEAPDLSREYGDAALTVEVVKDIEAAIGHIHKYGSSHTEAIVTENLSTAQRFLRAVDSACVFHNASTRFADGFRFGLGAEVGISTGRIHARGPVGVEGLLTSKWTLQSQQGHTVQDFATGTCEYTHRRLSLSQ